MTAAEHIAEADRLLVEADRLLVEAKRPWAPGALPPALVVARTLYAESQAHSMLALALLAQQSVDEERGS